MTTQYNNCTIIYGPPLIALVFGALFLFIVGNELYDDRAIISLASTGALVLSCLVLMTINRQSFVTGILLSLAIIYVLGLIGSPTISGVTGIIFLVLVVRRLLNTIRRPRLTNRPIVLFALFLTGILLGLSLLLGIDLGDNLFFLDEVITVAGNKDAQFNFVLSTMMKNYGIPSTGLHGIPPPEKYYVGTHYLFTSLANMSGLSVGDVFLYSGPFLIIPVLTGVLMHFSVYISSRKYTCVCKLGQR